MERGGVGVKKLTNTHLYYIHRYKPRFNLGVNVLVVIVPHQQTHSTVSPWLQNSELRTQNYLFDLIHSYFFTIIQFNIIVYNLGLFFVVFSFW